MLCKGLGRAQLVLSVREGGQACARGGEGRGDNIARPDGGELAATGLADGDTAGVDVELELETPESVNPVEPLDTDGNAGSVDGARGETSRRQDEAAASRTAQRLLTAPGGCVEGGQVGVEQGLQLGNSRCRVRGEQRAGKVGDGMSKSHGKAGGGHCGCGCGGSMQVSSGDGKSESKIKSGVLDI